MSSEHCWQMQNAAPENQETEKQHAVVCRQSHVRRAQAARKLPPAGGTTAPGAASGNGAGAGAGRKKIIIVGAGWAGFGAAKHLAEQGAHAYWRPVATECLQRMCDACILSLA